MFIRGIFTIWPGDFCESKRYKMGNGKLKIVCKLEDFVVGRSWECGKTEFIDMQMMTHKILFLSFTHRIILCCYPPRRVSFSQCNGMSQHRPSETYAQSLSFWSHTWIWTIPERDILLMKQSFHLLE